MSDDAHAKALELWQEGQRHHLRQELREAMRLYRASLALAETSEAHTFLGWALSAEGDVDGAIAECHLAIAADPDFGNPYNDIGAYLIQQGKLDEAIPWLERAKLAKRYEPRHFPHLNLGRIYQQTGKVSRAIAEFELALALHPHDPLATQSLAKLRALN